MAIKTMDLWCYLIFLPIGSKYIQSWTIRNSILHVLGAIKNCFLLKSDWNKYIFNATFLANTVNLHPLFLFWKLGSVCDPEKKLGTLLFEKSCVQKTKVIVIQKEKRQPGIFLFLEQWPCFFAPCFLQKAGSQIF